MLGCCAQIIHYTARELLTEQYFREKIIHYNNYNNYNNYTLYS